MSTSNEKPTLAGQRIKTRKRDEKKTERRDPTGFRDVILQGFLECKDLEQVSKYLDAAGSRVDYRRYGETLFDIIFAGGILAPGGSIVSDGDPDKPFKAELCLFMAENNIASARAYHEVLFKLIRRYKYLEKVFSEELKKLIMFLKGFNEEERHKLGMVMGLCLANGLGNPSCLIALYDDHLVKEGISLEFVTVVFKMWLMERDIQNLAASLKRGGMEGKLPNLLPINKRTQENFENHFKTAGLYPIVDYQRAKAKGEVRKELQKKLEEMIKEDAPVKEIIGMVREHKEISKMSDEDVVIMTWNTLMNSIEWNKKEELVADQALKHLKMFAPLFSALATTGRSELALVLKIQEYCYENQSFLKVFQKIVVLLYKVEVVSEEVILHWYKEGHSPKGKSVFLDQMKSFVEWLNNAEEESEEEEDD